VKQFTVFVISNCFSQHLLPEDGSLFVLSVSYSELVIYLQSLRLSVYLSHFGELKCSSMTMGACDALTSQFWRYKLLACDNIDGYR